MDRDKVTIVGAGNQGLAMAAYLGRNHVGCYLFNRTECHISKLLETKEIICKGIWSDNIKVCDVSSRIEDVLQKTILVTTPAYAHREIASLLAGYMDSSYTVLLSPGKVFGVIDFVETLKEVGCKELPLVAECQTTMCASRRIGEDRIKVYGIKKDIPIAAENVGMVMERMPECIRKCYRKVDSFIETSFGNIGMVLHPLPMLLNLGFIDAGRTFKYYREGITPAIAALIERLDYERLEVARKLGYELESIMDWMKRNYDTDGERLYEHIQANRCYENIMAPVSIHNRFIDEDIPYGLVPLEDTAKKLNIEVPIATAIISFANMIMGKDYRAEGRLWKYCTQIPNIQD